MSNSAGFPLNWQMSMGTNNITLHPLYAKYSAQTIGQFALVDIQADMKNIILTQETSSIVQWMRYVIDIKLLTLL